MHVRIRSRCSIAFALALAAPLFAAKSHAQLQFDELRKVHLPATTVSLAAVVFADVDADGDLDAIAVGIESHVMLNDGRGRFTRDRARIPVGQGTSLALGDVDGDGDVDIAIGDYGQNRLLLNDGKGSFADRSSNLPQIADPTTALALADVDGDRDLDLIIANSGLWFDTQNRLHLNDGNGVFTDATKQLPRDSARDHALTVGDVDNDGDVDFVTAGATGSGPSQVILYRNDGSGVFASTSGVPHIQEPTTSVVLADVDGNGHLDLVCGHGNAGLLTTHQLRLFLGDGKGSFADVTSTHIPLTDDVVHAVTLIDLDGDGDRDIVVGTSAASTRVRNRAYSNDGKGVFMDVTSALFPTDLETTHDVAAGDVDGDGDPDLLFANSQWAKLYINTGRRGFVDATASGLPSDLMGTQVVVTADFDADGDLDLILGNNGAAPSGKQNRLFLNDGFGRFDDATAGKLPAISDATVSMVAGDIDGDGDLDLACGTHFEANGLYLNDGAASFRPSTTPLPLRPNVTSGMTLIDVDADGDLDLITAGQGENLVYRNNGVGAFTVGATFHVGASHSVVAGDVDGDGDADLVFGNSGARHALFLNDGRGQFTDVSATQMPTSPGYLSQLALGDFDRDGDLDLVVANRGQANRYYDNDGRGVFTDRTAPRMPIDRDETYAVAAVDIDGDGDLDVVFGNQMPSIFGRASRVYLNNGSAYFQEAGTRFTADAGDTRAIAVGDVDGDGDPDLIFGNMLQGNRLYVNLLRQSSSPFVAHLGRDYEIDFHATSSFAPAGQFVLPFASLTSSRPGIEIPPFGLFRLGFVDLITLPPLAVPAPTGKVSIRVPLPNLDALAGRELHVQSLVIHATATSTWRLSNVSKDRLLR